MPAARKEDDVMMMMTNNIKISWRFGVVGDI